MRFLAIVNDEPSQWFHSLVQPEVLPFVVAIVAIAGGLSFAAAKGHHAPP